MIATPTGWAARSDAESLIAPGTEGYLGILANHSPLMTALGVGALQYRDSSGYDHTLALTEGFLEVSDNIVTIIADAAELKEAIDLERAKSALERAKDRLTAAATDHTIDIERARAAYRRALNRIRIAEGEVHLR
jgi:F-type H+-transporting ATPase subunit epsilon